MCLYIIGKHWGSFLSHCIRRRDSTPRIVEVPEDSDKILDWGSSDEITEFAREPGAIRVDNYYSEEDSRDGTGGVF